MTHRYFCHACQAYQDVVMAPTPTCSVCHSQFVEQTPSQEATATTHVDIDNDLSERLNQTTLGGAPTTTTSNTSNTSDTDDDDDDEIYTDDEDEDYEDIDSDHDYEDEDDDYDEEDEISAFIESHHHAHGSRHHHHFYDQDEWDYELDRYYDDILGYNHASDFYDGMDDIAPQWSSYFSSHLDIDESNRHWERFLRAMFWPNEDQDRPAPATQNDIDQLEKRQLKEGDADADTECSICQENFGVDNEIMTLPCKHEYHGLCIRRWLQVSATCPMCRSTIISEAESQRRREQEEQPQVTSHPNSLGGRTFTFTSPDRRHAIGIMVADVTSLPYPPYPEDDVDYYEDYDELEDEYEDGDYYDSGEEEDEEEEEEDPWDQVDRQEPISHRHGWRHHHHHQHGPMFICPHGHLIPGFNRLRRAPPGETAHSTNHPIAEFHQPNPMDEVD